MAKRLEPSAVDAGDVSAPVAGARVELSIRPYAAKVRVQRLPGRHRMSPPPLGGVDWDLPPNHASGTEPTHFWLGPDERLIVSTSLSRAALLDTLRPFADPQREFFTDVSSALAIVRVGGRGALSLLATDCTLDLEGGELAPGRCAQTLFAQTSVLVHRRADVEGYDLYVERPTLQFVHDWLQRNAC